MPHAFTKNHIHLIFSTKQRLKLIPDEMQLETWSYITGICHNLRTNSCRNQWNGGPAHVLFHLPPNITLAKAVSALKANSSRWLNERKIKFARQQGYAAFSVSASNVPFVAKYIRNQREHHKKISFETEFLTLLEKHGIKFDPKYALG